MLNSRDGKALLVSTSSSLVDSLPKAGERRIACSLAKRVRHNAQAIRLPSICSHCHRTLGYLPVASCGPCTWPGALQPYSQWWCNLAKHSFLGFVTGFFPTRDRMRCYEVCHTRDP